MSSAICLFVRAGYPEGEPSREPGDKVKVGLIVEDHAGAQKWLRSVLQEVFANISVTVVGNLAGARDQLAHLQAVGLNPELALIDLSLPDGTGIDFIRIRPINSRLPVKMASTHHLSAARSIGRRRMARHCMAAKSPNSKRTGVSAARNPMVRPLAVTPDTTPVASALLIRV